MAIQLDEATLIALVVESIFFGIFTVLFSISMYILVFRRRRDLNKPMIAVSIMMYIMALTHLIVSAQRATIAFLRKESEAGEASQWLSMTSDPLYLTQVGVYVIQTLIGDSFLAYRLYVVWERDKRLLLAALTCLVASLVCGIIAETNAALVGSSALIFIPRLKHWILSFFCLTLFTNLSCTGLIAYKIWSIERKLSKTIRGRERSSVISVIIESSAVYSVSLISLTGLFASGSWAQYIILDLLVPLIGVVFTLIIVRIGLGLSHGAAISSQAGHFSQRVNDLGYVGSQQAAVYPLVVQIEQSRIITDDVHDAKVISRAESSDD